MARSRSGICQLCGVKYSSGGRFFMCPDCATDRNIKEHSVVVRGNYTGSSSDVYPRLTLKQWLDTLDYFAWLCAYCQDESYYLLEHFINRWHTTKQNCVPACHICNIRKNNHSVIDIWKGSGGFDRGMFPTLEMIIRINNYLHLDLNEIKPSYVPSLVRQQPLDSQVTRTYFLPLRGPDCPLSISSPISLNDLYEDC